MKEEEGNKRNFWEEEHMKAHNNKYCQKYKAIKVVGVLIMITDINIKTINNQIIKDLN